MTPRLNPFAAAPKDMKARLDYSMGVGENGLEKSLLELVKIRASQIMAALGARCAARR